MGEMKRIKMRYVPMPPPHNKYIYYVAQTCTDKKEIEKKCDVGEIEKNVFLFAI